MVGWSGFDTGANSCNTCSCYAANALVCTERWCENTEQAQSLVVQGVDNNTAITQASVEENFKQYMAFYRRFMLLNVGNSGF